MTAKRAYEKAANLFSDDVIFEEYCTRYGDFPLDTLQDLYNRISIEGNSLTPKQFFTIVKNSTVEFLDQVNEENTLYNILSNNLISNNESGNTTLQIYFNNIKDIYSKVGNIDNIEHTEENREIILNKLLKLVIYIAKRYQGLGVPLEDLISAGNVGLCIAWNKFDPNKTPPKEKFLEKLEEYEDITPDCLENILSEVLQYGKIKDEFENSFKDYRLYSKEEYTKWINKHIKRAKFSSVAAMWIRAYIMQELNNNSRVVKKPKSEIDKDRLLHNGAHIKENTVSIDNSVDDDINQNIVNNKDLWTEDNDICNENQIILYNQLNNMMKGVSQRDKFILLRMYGIGYPKPQTPKEIALDTGLTIARVSQISLSVIEKMKVNSTPEDFTTLMSILNDK